jgi:hypothetical protein
MQEQQAIIAKQQKQIEAFTTGLQKVSAQLFCAPPQHLKRQNGTPGSTGKSSQTISIKPVGAWVGVSALDCKGRTIWIVDAHRDDGKRFIARDHEKLIACNGIGRISG